MYLPDVDRCKGDGK